MMSSRSRTFDYVIIILLLANLALTAYAIFKPPAGVAQVDAAASGMADVNDAEAHALASEFIAIYNADDLDRLYDEFDPLAKAQITKEQLGEQLTQVRTLIGSISDPAFSSALMAGTDNGRQYINLMYKVRLSERAFSAGDMKLTATRREKGLSLVGFHVTGRTTSGN